jgi:putative sporulation protein YyaC
MEYSFNVFNKLAADGVSMSVSKLLAAKAAQAAKTARSARLAAYPYVKEAKNQPPQSQKAANAQPIIVCIGSDLAIGDSLGPIAGSMLKHKIQGINVFLYGTLSAPVTAKEIKYVRKFLSETHRGRQVIAIDAAVGEEGDVGLIKITDSPLYPGAGANKKLGSIGDISVMGIVAEKSVFNYGLLNATRLNLVYSMAEIISDGIASLLWNAQTPLQAPMYLTTAQK